MSKTSVFKLKEAKKKKVKKQKKLANSENMTSWESQFKKALRRSLGISRQRISRRRRR